MKLSALVLAIVPVLLAGCERSGSPPVSRDGAASAPPDTVARDTMPIEEPVEVAAAVLRSYYQAIDHQRYEDAYRLWASGGEASGKTFEEFRAGFANTASVLVDVGPPGPVEGAAGSRYVEIPVRISATTRDGQPQRFAGTYTLRRSVVDGATREQRTWRIASARIRPA